MKVYCNGFWSGFLENTNPVNTLFFMKLFEKIYSTEIEFTDVIENADILLENTQYNQSYRTYKPWKHTYLFSGESYLHPDHIHYSCVLYGNRTHKNIINVPLYIPYIYSSFDESYITTRKPEPILTVPKNDVLVIVSNPGGIIRNQFINMLQDNFNVTFAGNYKNNIGGQLDATYNTREFRDYVSNYKFILSMENSEEDTYITEKITHGILAGSIPIYWGSKRVTDYFTTDRILEVRRLQDSASIIQTMKKMTNEEWLRRVNLDPFTKFGHSYTIQTIANQVKRLLFSSPFPNMTSLYMICNPEYEPIRYSKLENMCLELGLKEYHCNFVCPTFKHTITDECMRQLNKTNRIGNFRHFTMRKSEMSLFLNFEEVLKHIEATYSDGIFLLLEADAYGLPTIRSLNTCLEKLIGKEWSAINIGSEGEPLSFRPCDSYVEQLGFRAPLTHDQKRFLESNCIEDISNPEDTDVRFMRKYHTRCTDSQLWSYNGCCQMLRYMNINHNYDIPLDYYITECLETHTNIKYFWSSESYFNQSSNRGGDASTIQSDVS